MKRITKTVSSFMCCLAVMLVTAGFSNAVDPREPPVRAGTYLVLTKSNRYARADNSNFNSRYLKNLAFGRGDSLLRGGTKVRFTGNYTKRNPGWGLEVTIESGDKKGETVWMYYKDNEKTILPLPSNFVLDDEDARENPSASVFEAVAGYHADETCDSCRTRNSDPTEPLAKTISWVSGQFSPLAPGAIGARQVMATMFQSCSVLDMLMPVRRGKNPFDYVRSDRRAECRDVGNPRYGWGGKVRMTSDTIDVVKGRNPGIDCSGFIMAAWAAAGLRTVPDSDAPSTYIMNTQSMLSRVGKSRSCLLPAQMLGEDTLRSGDVIVQTRGRSKTRHTVMVESVGPDPFGLRKFTRRNQCNYRNFDVKAFDFTLLQSSGGIGPARWRARDYLPRSGASFRSAVMTLALKACYAKFDDVFVSAKGKVAGVSYSLVRHRDTAECRNPNPPALKYGQCAEGCEQLAFPHDS